MQPQNSQFPGQLPPVPNNQAALQPANDVSNTTNLAVPEDTQITDQSNTNSVSNDVDKTSYTAPQIADDNDLIEKEWVEQAKQVFQQASHDPYEQNRLFSELKSQYLQKRYGRGLKSNS